MSRAEGRVSAPTAIANATGSSIKIATPAAIPASARQVARFDLPCLSSLSAFSSRKLETGREKNTGHENDYIVDVAYHNAAGSDSARRLCISADRRTNAKLDARVSDRRIRYVKAYKNDLAVLAAAALLLDGTPTATADSTLPAATRAGFADKLYRLDCGHSLANDELVWTPGENVGKSIEFASTCWLIQRENEWLLWDTGVPESALNDPKGWSTLPKLIVYHLDKTLTDQLAAIGLKTNDIKYVALSHTHGDHIGNVDLFPN